MNIKKLEKIIIEEIEKVLLEYSPNQKDKPWYKKMFDPDTQGLNIDMAPGVGGITKGLTKAASRLLGGARFASKAASGSNKINLADEMYKFVASEAVVWVARNGKKVAFGGGKIQPRNYKFIQSTVENTLDKTKNIDEIFANLKKGERVHIDVLSGPFKGANLELKPIMQNGKYRSFTAHIHDIPIK